MSNKLADSFNHALGLHSFDYNQVGENVFIGTNMCCQMGFDKELLSKGVMADISLEKERIDAPDGVEYFLWLPTEDEHAPTPDKLLLGAQTLEFLLERNIKTYIHCKNGHGRAPTLFAAYLIKMGMTAEQAFASIKAKRPVVHINDEQMKALEEFERSLR